MRKALVFGAAVLLLLGGVSYAVMGPFEVASLTHPTLPESSSSYRESPQDIMHPIQQDVNPQDTQNAQPYDDGITWSWEEKVAPIDVLEYVKDLPYNEWVEIDEKTTRQLFEGVVQKALKQMQIEGNGGEFEEVLRQKLLYFTPEFEYYYPPYEEDFSKRIVRFPVKIMRKDDSDNTIVFQLGRAEDDEREIELYFKTLDDGNQILRGIALYRDRYVVGEIGPPKKESLFLAWKNPNFQEVCLSKRYFNSNWTNFGNREELLSFHQGNPAPVEDNTTSEPPLDLSGVDILFEPAVFDTVYENWEPYDASYFQGLRSIINLCKLQLGLIDNGQELEKVLRREFLEYVPWKPIDPNNFNAWEEPFIELVSIRRESTPEPDKTVVYHFDIGDMFARDVYITFTRELGANIPYDWGIKQISFIQPVTMKYKDKDGVVKQGVGELTKSFTFDYTQDYLTGRDPTEIVADYEKVLLDPRGYMLTPLSEQLIAYFKYGEPSAHNIR